MDKKSQQEKSKPASTDRQRALDDVSVEDLDKIREHQSSTKGAYPVDEEWLLVTEFAIKFGWQAYLDVKADKITGVEMRTLIEASRRLEWLETYRQAIASFAGSISTQSKKPATAFRAATKDILKRTRLN